jgi:hypothetical protein
MSTATASHRPAAGLGLQIGLRVGQVILAGMFANAGWMKLNLTAGMLAGQPPGPLAPPLWLLKTIGALELAGVAGILLPTLTRVRPRLTALAALGFLGVMLLATPLHVIRGEYQVVPITIGLGLIAAFVAWGRFFAAPISSR